MRALLPAWLCLLLGLVPLEIQTRALTLQSLSHRHRFASPRASKDHKSSYIAAMPTPFHLPVALDDSVAEGDWGMVWQKEPPRRSPEPLPDNGDGVPWDLAAGKRRSRGRRHARSGGARGQAHLMRVGCVLGTCQVQNLSHRLYQLIGQSGRDDSSPINPRSPHSYG